MILIGRKRRGVFNLDDQELLQRIVQQTRLTLGVLHLLEREKLLMQKNYEANLTALRSQINPHFLFNTLNTISALIHDRAISDDAEVAVEKLAFIFRYTLKNSDKATVTLKDVLSLVRTYLDIEKIRFGRPLAIALGHRRKPARSEPAGLCDPNGCRKLHQTRDSKNHRQGHGFDQGQTPRRTRLLRNRGQWAWNSTTSAFLQARV